MPLRLGFEKKTEPKRNEIDEKQNCTGREELTKILSESLNHPFCNFDDASNKINSELAGILSTLRPVKLIRTVASITSIS